MLLIWIIDDSSELISSTVGYWKKQTGKTVSYRHFPIAALALETLCAPETALPDIIVVDGKLDKDEAPLNRGVEVVRRIMCISQPKQSHIIAYSSDPIMNDEMVAAGARLSFWKLDYQKVGKYFLENAAIVATTSS